VKTLGSNKIRNNSNVKFEYDDLKDYFFSCAAMTVFLQASQD